MFNRYLLKLVRVYLILLSCEVVSDIRSILAEWQPILQQSGLFHVIFLAPLILAAVPLVLPLMCGMKLVAICIFLLFFVNKDFSLIKKKKNWHVFIKRLLLLLLLLFWLKCKIGILSFFKFYFSLCLFLFISVFYFLSLFN